MICQNDWFKKFGDLALDRFGRIREPKRTGCDSAWHKTCDWNSTYNGGTPRHYFVNDLLGQRISITEQQYDDKELTTPNNLSQ